MFRMLRFCSDSVQSMLRMFSNVQTVQFSQCAECSESVQNFQLMFRIFNNVQTLFSQCTKCSESVPNFQPMFRIFSNVQTLFRISSTKTGLFRISWLCSASVPILFIRARRLKRILSQSFCAHVIIAHHDIANTIRLTTPTAPIDRPPKPPTYMVSQ